MRPLVMDPFTDVEVIRGIRAANSLEAGIVVAAVPPDIRRGYELTWELLEALGKQGDVSGAGREETLNWEVLAAWLLAHGVEHIVLVDAQWLRRSMLEDVIDLAAVTGATLWLVAQYPLEDQYEEAVGYWPIEPATPMDLATMLEATRSEVQPATEPDFPEVPSDNFVSFRSQARRQLDEDAFALVDERYRSAFGAAVEWFAHNMGSISEPSVLSLIRAQLHACACADEMMTVLRGIQAAAFRAGWLVSVELARLVATAERAAAAAIHSPATWVRLRAYREPFRGAACALAACELSLDAMSLMTLADVAADGSNVQADTGGGVVTVEVPEGASIYMRALVQHRVIQGASEDDLLFVRDDTTLESKYLADAIRCPITEVGVPLYSQQVERADLDPKRWSRRWGLSVQEL